METAATPDRSENEPQFVLSIPPRDLDTIENILKLSEETRDALWRAIETAPIGASNRELELRVTSETALSTNDVRDILDLMSRMYLTKVRADDINSDEFAEGITHTISRERNIVVDERLRGFVHRLLSFERVLGIKARAVDVMNEYERAVRAVRILTDIRPVFDGGNETSLEATVVVHNLRIKYSDNAGHTKDFIVALEGDDLKSLSVAVERAIRKETEIRAFMAKSGMPCIATTNDD